MCCSKREMPVSKVRRNESLLLSDHISDNPLLLLQLSVVCAHRVHKSGYQLTQKWLILAQKGICVPHSSTQNTPDHITRLGIAWQLTISNTKGNGTNVVCDHTHSNIFFSSTPYSLPDNSAIFEINGVKTSVS